MKDENHGDKKLSPDEYVDWALEERKKRPSKTERSMIDTEVARLRKEGALSEDLYQKYLAGI